MTRKCVLCKETNYRNTYSFFSAPKDPDTRKKWQDAIGIESYAVTDDTYVCSKHFHKDDIITHWVSGVPPHVITIKYKKCRLRPGAVPGKNFCEEENAHSQGNLGNSDTNVNKYLSAKLQKTDSMNQREVDFHIRRTEDRLQINDKEDIISSFHHQYSHDCNDSTYIHRRISLSKIKSAENNLHICNDKLNSKMFCKHDLNQHKENTLMEVLEKNVTSDTNSVENVAKQRISKKHKNSNMLYKDSETLSRNSMSEEDVSMIWKYKATNDATVEKNTTDNNIKFENYDQLVNKSDCNQLNAYYAIFNDTDENELLFEDLLEVCTEVLLPRGWSCLVTSKGHSTTIVYLYMGMTNSGMPFTEKQVFIKSDMMVHCAAVNREINPLIHNLIREGKHSRIQRLLDIEELIDEFDQRTVCLGVRDTDEFQEINSVKIAYKDGIKWRHISCPLLLNNDSSRCTKCISLSQVLHYKLRKFSHSRPIPMRGQRNIYPFHLNHKRKRGQDHLYKFTKVFKQ